MRRFLFGLLLPFALGSAASAQTLVKGAFVEGVACPSDPTQTYTLYLPSSYDAAKPSPLLFIFDPRGRGTQAAEVFKAAAERYGWIIASSNNTASDGEWEPNRRALAAMWPDVLRTYAIDKRRIYATGFSGGASVAWVLAETSKAIAGIIGVGAPNQPDAKLPAKDVAWFGIAGRSDFNFLEAKIIDARMSRNGAAHRVEFFDGGHRWPPPELASRAIAWMEMLAMKEGRRPKDPALAAATISDELAYANALRTAGFLTDARRTYETIVTHYGAIGDVAEAVGRAREMDADERFRKASRDEQRIDTRENSSLDEMAKGLRPLFEPELPLAGQLIAALRISALKKAASGSGYEAASATRVLERLSVQTSFYIPRDFERQKHFDRAALALEIATEIHPERPRGWIDLAANRARLGRKSLAVAALERAISAGYTDAAALRSDERFADLRETPEFSRVLEKMRSR